LFKKEPDYSLKDDRFNLDLGPPLLAPEPLTDEDEEGSIATPTEKKRKKKKKKEKGKK